MLRKRIAIDEYCIPFESVVALQKTGAFSKELIKEFSFLIAYNQLYLSYPERPDHPFMSDPDTKLTGGLWMSTTCKRVHSSRQVTLRYTTVLLVTFDRILSMRGLDRFKQYLSLSVNADVKMIYDEKEPGTVSFFFEQDERLRQKNFIPPLIIPKTASKKSRHSRSSLAG